MTTIDIKLRGNVILHVERGRIIGSSVIDEDGELHFVPVDDKNTEECPANGYVAVFVGRGYPAYGYMRSVEEEEEIAKAGNGNDDAKHARAFFLVC